MTTTASPAHPSPTRLGLALALIGAAQLLLLLDASVATIALPEIGAKLDMDQGELTWVISGYSLVFGGLLLLGGRLGDRLGHRRLFVAGLVVLAAGSLLARLATSGALLLAGRAGQAVGAALAAPAALALITTTFPAGPARSRALGVYAAMSGAGAGVGLLLGGWLTGTDGLFGLDGWRLGLLLNVPVALAIAALAPGALRDSESRPETGVDLPGAALSVLGLASLVYGLTTAGEEGWGHLASLAWIGVGAVVLAAFFLVESRAAHPLLPLRILADRNRATTLVVAMLLFAAMFSVFYFLTQYLQRGLGYGPLRAGIAFLPLSVAIFVGATLAGRALARFGPRPVAGASLLVAGVALALLSSVSVRTAYWTGVFPSLVVMALGVGVVLTVLTATAVHAVEPADAGAASGAFIAMQQAGGAVGLAVLGTVATAATRSASGAEAVTFTAGASRALLVAGLMVVAASLVAWVGLRVRLGELSATSDAPMPGA